MSTNDLTAEERTAFEFAVPTPGKVNIANTSYGAEETREHTYTVDVENGSATGCTCPDDSYRPGRCKHRDAVESVAAVLAAASPEVDGDTCPNGTPGCPGADGDELPCFECYSVEDSR